MGPENKEGAFISSNKHTSSPDAEGSESIAATQSKVAFSIVCTTSSNGSLKQNTTMPTQRYISIKVIAGRAGLIKNKRNK
jgi:hypothetical protein